MGDIDKENRHDDDHDHEHSHGGHGHGHDHDHEHSHDHHIHVHIHVHEHDDDHEHEHSHDGHDHDHEHEHEHSHDHGHDHSHDHDHGDDHEHEHIGTDGGINVSRHEGALILSTQIVVAAPYGGMVKDVEAALNELAAWVEARNGVVGHIKASVSENGRSSTISNTGDGVAAREFAPDITTVSMASIIFAVPEDEYCEKFEEVVESLKALTTAHERIGGII